MLNNLDWMNVDTRAYKKSDLMTPDIVYPKEILNDKGRFQERQ